MLQLHACVSDSLAAGWPSQGPRRTRRPARQKSVDQSNQKGAAKKRKRRRAVQPVQITSPDQRISLKTEQSKPASYANLYEQIASGQQQGHHQSTREGLFKDGTVAVTTTPGLRAKLCPVFATTSTWTRIQRKVLPKYLFVLDAVTAVHLLKCLSRLQPPIVAAANGSAAGHVSQAATAASVHLTRAELGQPQHHMQQQHPRPPGPGLSQLAEMCTSISGPIRARSAALQQEGPELDAAAVARGFLDAATEREEFELMLTAVYASLQPKLLDWPGRALLTVLGLAGQLHLRHEGFIQAWCSASASKLAQQSMPHLLACLEALSRLRAHISTFWILQWVQATQSRLAELSLPQLSMLQLLAGDMQLQLPHSWWQQFQAAVMHHADGSSSSSTPRATATPSQKATGISAPAAAPAGSTWQQQQEQQVKENSQPQVQAVRGITMPEADALCSLLWTSSQLKGQAVPKKTWLDNCLVLCLQACQQGHISCGAAVFLLAACSYGACQRLPRAAAARAAALGLILQRMAKLPSPRGVELLLACLQLPAVSQQLPAGFMADLSERLAELLPELPTQLLLQLPGVLSACGQQQPEERLLAGFALVTQARLQELSVEEVAGLLQHCEGLDMPGVWRSTLQQQLDQM